MANCPFDGWTWTCWLAETKENLSDYIEVERFGFEEEEGGQK